MALYTGHDKVTVANHFVSVLGVCDIDKKKKVCALCRSVLFGFCNILDNVMLSHEFSICAKPAQTCLA